MRLTIALQKADAPDPTAVATIVPDDGPIGTSTGDTDPGSGVTDTDPPDGGDNNPNTGTTDTDPPDGGDNDPDTGTTDTNPPGGDNQPGDGYTPPPDGGGGSPGEVEIDLVWYSTDGFDGFTTLTHRVDENPDDYQTGSTETPPTHGAYTIESSSQLSSSCTFIAQVLGLPPGAEFTPTLTDSGVTSATISDDSYGIVVITCSEFFDGGDYIELSIEYNSETYGPIRASFAGY